MTEETILTTTTPLPNDPEARSPDGTLLDVGVPPAVPEGDAPAPAPVIPEQYDFKFPDNQEVDKTILDQYVPLFKELKLPQDAAQKLVDTYAKNIEAQQKALIKGVEDYRAKLVEQTKSDPVLGPKLDTVRTDINRALTHLPADVVTNLKAAWDFTGAGDHPAIIRGMYELAKLVNEGTHISGRGPSAEGQTAAGKVTPPSVAAALYPTLPTASR